MAAPASKGEHAVSFPLLLGPHPEGLVTGRPSLGAWARVAIGRGRGVDLPLARQRCGGAPVRGWLGFEGDGTYEQTPSDPEEAQSPAIAAE